MITEYIYCGMFFPGHDGHCKKRAKKEEGVGGEATLQGKHQPRTVIEEICVANSGGISPTCPKQ